MINLKDIHSLTEFQRNAKQYVKQIKETQQPLVLTVNGKAEVVVQDAIAYQEILKRLEYVESVLAIRQGITEFESGEGKLARTALEELRKNYDISR